MTLCWSTAKAKKSRRLDRSLICSTLSDVFCRGMPRPTADISLQRMQSCGNDCVTWQLIVVCVTVVS